MTMRDDSIALVSSGDIPALAGGVSRRTVANWISRGDFPQPIGPEGRGSETARGPIWIRSEVEEWIARWLGEERNGRGRPRGAIR